MEYSSSNKSAAEQAAARQAERADNRRKFARVQVSLRIELENPEQLDNFVHTYIYDISLGGMFVKTEQPRPKGTHVRFRIPDPQGTFMVEVTGEVVREVPPGIVPKAFPVAGMAIQFHPLDEDARMLLQGIIESRTAA